ncbi:unnamed protein product, partial [Rotaria socialis]
MDANDTNKIQSNSNPSSNLWDYMTKAVSAIPSGLK